MGANASLYTLTAVISVASAAAGFVYGASHHEKQTPHERPTNTEGQDQNVPSDDDEESIADGDLSAVTAGFMQPCKLVLVVRTDLKMTPGKIAAQCGHATLACYKALVKKNPKVSPIVLHRSRTAGAEYFVQAGPPLGSDRAKIALKASSEDEILELEAIAKSLNLCARSIQDAGMTQVEAGSRTVLGIGPAPVELVNKVTGHLRLL